MFVKIHATKTYPKGNTQSCSDLVQYLEKENEGKELMESEFFFNDTTDHAMSSKVINDIDNNVKTLKAEQAKFFMISINPSPKELKHMAKQATGREISGVWEMSATEKERYNTLFKEYVNKEMDVYAKNFNRDITKDNLVYYGKIEQERTFKGTDKEVKLDMAKSGAKKPGLQTHAHVIVSRMDKDMKMSLSPLANSRGSKNHQLNGKSVQVGFNRDTFKEQSEKEFDKHYRYQREKSEQFREQNPYYGAKQVQQTLNSQLHTRATQQVLALDQSNTLLTAKSAITQVNKVSKNLKLAQDVLNGTTQIKNPGYAAVKAITRFIGKIKDIGHSIEH
jgi:hypothetical protein